MIDLHLHTTASDGLLSPDALVARAAGCGLQIISVTDHDTLAGFPAASAAARRYDVRLVAGVEITAVEAERDVHLLAYFFDPADEGLAAFLETQRENRLRRVEQIADRLSVLGCPIECDVGKSVTSPGASIGRPQVADALIAAGHARDRDDAFDRFLGDGRPAFVPRTGPVPETVLSVVGQARGIVSMAHPGLTKLDHIIPRLAAAGLAALEARHSDHAAATERRYRQLAAELGLAVSGGSDFHGDSGRRKDRIGQVTITAEELLALETRRR